MLSGIIIAVVCFITFCATPLGRELIQKMNDYNDKREMEKIEKDIKCITGSDFLDREKQQEQELRRAQIEQLKKDFNVLAAYNQYLDDINNRRRRVKKVLYFEEFIEKYYLKTGWDINPCSR